jgi:hydroxymethylbilane synthase
MRIGSRGSALALAQAGLVAELLGGAETGVEVVVVSTSGDRGVLVGDKSRWVKELEAALLAGEIDAAVHSAKDVPGELPDGLVLAAVPERVDARDALCGAASLEALPLGARVGTSSLRRAAGLRALRPDLEVVALHGNVDTRLTKLEKGRGESGITAIVLAMAGLERLGYLREVGCALDELVPAPGQGTLVLETRAEDAETRTALSAIDDPHVAASLAAERALARALGASCNTPLGAHAVLADDGGMTLRAFLGLPDGSAWLRDELTDPLGASPERLGEEVAERMRAAGADELLAACEALGDGAVPPASTPEGTRL